MKGIIFTEFLTMVEETFSANMVDDIIEDTNLPSGGSYTAVGTYPHGEMNALVTSLSKKTGMSLADLMQAFGEYLFRTLAREYPHFLQNASGLLDFLNSIEDYIHIEVRKLYPDAELPGFETRYLSDTSLEMIYRSDRHYGDLAEGLIKGAMAHYGHGRLVKREMREDKSVLFVVEAHG